MDRRSMLGLCGAAVTALAGCGGSTDGERTTRQPTTRSTTTTDAAPLAVRSAAAPETVQIGQPYTVRFAVTNRTDRTQTLQTPVSVRTEEGWQPFDSLRRQVPAGETTVEREFAAPRFLGTFRFRTDAPTVEWEIEATERRLGFAESFTTPQGLDLTVLGGTFADTYQGSDNRTVTPAANGQFLLVRLRIVNSTDESVSLPPFGTFAVAVRDETYQVALDDPSRRLTVDSGDRTQVELPFVVPTSTTAADVAVRWTPRFQVGRTVVVWRA